MTSENNGMYMPVAPAYGGGYGGDGMFGGNGAWWIIILLAVLGWGNGFGGGFGGNNGGGFVNAEMQRGFDQQNSMAAIAGVQNAVTTGFGNVQTALCNGFAGVNQGVANGFAQAEIAANARQIADMNQNFQMQQAFQNCCCENRLASAQLNTTVTQEAATTRSAGAANTQAILDKLCQLELDGVKQNYEGQIRALQNQLDAARTDNQSLRFAASQIAQNGQIVDGIYNRLDTCPVGTTPVYGRTPIFSCNNGCGCNGFAG